MRSERIGIGEWYHIYNRGAGKQTIFRDQGDALRFLFSILYFQGKESFRRIDEYTKMFVATGSFSDDSDIQEVASSRFVTLGAFCLMPNHFHLLVHETKESGIARYMQRLLNSFTKFSNTKYEKSGHLFQGPYRAVHIATNEQLLHLSAYIHKNPASRYEFDISSRGQHRVLTTLPYEQYGLSSYRDYVSSSRWGPLLDPHIVLDQFPAVQDYADFVKTSTAKDTDGMLIDSED